MKVVAFSQEQRSQCGGFLPFKNIQTCTGTNALPATLPLGILETENSGSRSPGAPLASRLGASAAASPAKTMKRSQTEAIRLRVEATDMVPSGSSSKSRHLSTSL